MLEERVKQLESEQETVQWYIRTLEDGLDAKHIMKDYYKAKDKIAKLEQRIED